MLRLASRLCLALVSVLLGTLGSLPLVRAATPAVSVSPATVTLRAGTARQFGVSLYGVGSPLVWSVNGIPGGNATIGLVTPTGLYVAPPTFPGANPVVSATAGTPPQTAAAAVTWLNPVPVITGLNPSAVNVGTFTIQVNGSGFLAQSQVLLNGAPIPATFVSPTQLTFQATITTAGTVTLSVSNPDPGAATSSGRNLKVMEPLQVTASPAKATVRLGATSKFSAKIANAVDRSVVWSVNGVPGGNATVGTIAPDGTYTAPNLSPEGGLVTLGLASVASPSATSSSVVTLINPTPVIDGITPTQLVFGSQTILVTGKGFVPNSEVRFGTNVVPVQFLSPTQITATVMLEPIPGGLVAFRVRNPDPGAATSAAYILPVGPAAPRISTRAAGRFLEQAAWGASAADIARVQELGFEGWLAEQLAAPLSTYAASDDSSDNLTRQQSEFFNHALRNPDVLRQRVAFALGQIFVVSGLKTGQPRQMVPFQNLLLKDAFGTYAQLLRDVTLSPTMGVYLDMVDNDQANLTTGALPNENYSREVQQLFSLGTILLNPDGTPKLNAQGQTIPTYTQDTIFETTRALTGWTFPGKAIKKGHNKPNFKGPMIPVETNHDSGPKIIVGGVELPAGQTAQQDLDAVLAAIGSHPNVAPFISLRLIQHLVAGNPSPQYLGRISAVFTETGGDLGAVVQAILLDPEARAGDDPGNPVPPGAGHLREPVLYVLNLVRAVNATVSENNPLESLAAEMGQHLFYSPSVFNYYSPLYRTASGQLAPEFQLLNSSSALVRANAVQSLVSRGLDGNASVNLSPFTALASQPERLVEAVDNAFLFGRLPAELKASIVTAISATKDSKERARNAIYLVATSSLYQVQH